MTTTVLSIALTAALLIAGAAMFLWVRVRRSAAAVRTTLETVRTTLEARVVEAQEERQRFGADILRLVSELDQKKAHCDALTTWAGKLEGVRDRLEADLANERAPVRPPRGEEELTEAELRAAFDVDTDNPLWVALHQVLDGKIVEAVDDVAPAPSPVFSGESRTHSAGELNSLREFQREILQRHRSARRAKPVEAPEGVEAE